MDAFTEFEHEGWERVAGKYDSTWASSTRQFIPPLLRAGEVAAGMSVLDVGCGPGYVSAAALECGAVPIGLDFSREMVGLAQQAFPAIEFREGDAQNLPFPNTTFDRVVANFALLHLAEPERACSEACRVQVTLPPGPPYYLFESPEAFRTALKRAGFDGATMTFHVHRTEWKVPTADFVFEAELNAGVRTAGFLARQTPEALSAIRGAINQSVRAYASGDGFAIPIAGYVVATRKAI